MNFAIYLYIVQCQFYIGSGRAFNSRVQSQSHSLYFLAHTCVCVLLLSDKCMLFAALLNMHTFYLDSFTQGVLVSEEASQGLPPVPFHATVASRSA